MSEVTTTTEAPKVTRKRESTKLVPFSSCHVAFGKVKNIDASRAAKQNRDYIRRNFDNVCAVWPELKKSQKVNRDNSNYPKMIPANAAKMIVTRTVPARKSRKS